MKLKKKFGTICIVLGTFLIDSKASAISVAPLTFPYLIFLKVCIWRGYTVLCFIL